MVCRIKNRHTFKSLPILNSAYFTECRFVIRHITQTDTETETEANFTHPVTHSHTEHSPSTTSSVKLTMVHIHTRRIYDPLGHAKPSSLLAARP